MTMYRATGPNLSKLADTEIVKVGGLSLSAAAAGRRFPNAVLANVGLYLEYREPDLGDGWDAPRIGITPDGAPCALLPAIIRTAADVAEDGTRLIVARAQVLQEEAAGAYAWPEASAWIPLREQAREWYQQTATIGEVLAAAAGVRQTLVGDERGQVAVLAQGVMNIAIAVATDAAENGLPAPEYTPLQIEASDWISTAKLLGEDLAADCGPDAPVDEIAQRAASVLRKADAFREAVGVIKRWRRQALATIDAALQAGGSRQEVESLVEAAMTRAASLAAMQASG